jgi:hypothetical protein
MSERRFRDLEEALICRGVAVRHAKRAGIEMESHHRELVKEAIQGGATPEDARRRAHEVIGTDLTLIERFACCKELRSWSYRWPMGYALAPLVTFAGLSVAVMLGLLGISIRLAGYLHHVRVPVNVSGNINLAVVVLFLWVLPIAVALGFGIIAWRQRVALFWPVAGIAALCFVTALLNVQFILTGGPHPGFSGAGIGLQLKALPYDLGRALGKAALPLIVLGWLRYQPLFKRLLLE